METGKDQQAPHHLLAESSLMQMANDRDQAFKEHWTNRFVSSSNLESVTRKGLASTGIRWNGLFTQRLVEHREQVPVLSHQKKDRNVDDTMEIRKMSNLHRDDPHQNAGDDSTRIAAGGHKHSAVHVRTEDKTVDQIPSIEET